MVKFRKNFFPLHFFVEMFSKFYLISAKFYQVLRSFTSSDTKFYQIPPENTSAVHSLVMQ